MPFEGDSAQRDVRTGQQARPYRTGGSASPRSEQASASRSRQNQQPRQYRSQQDAWDSRDQRGARSRQIPRDQRDLWDRQEYRDQHDVRGIRNQQDYRGARGTQGRQDRPERYRRQTPDRAPQTWREDGDRQRRDRRPSGQSQRSGDSNRNRTQDRNANARRSGSSGRNGGKGKQQPRTGGNTGIAALLERLPDNAVMIGVLLVGIIVLLVLVFAVLVPSCSRTEEPQQEQVAEQQTGFVAEIGKKAAEKKNAIETANQVGSLETSNANVEALVALLGEEETAKLVAQAKTNKEALWIAAHPDEYAFDGVDVQYKILKLAADEPAAIPYVRYFPVKYPMADAVDDSELAMSAESPSEEVPSTKIPHLYQWDRRWAYTIYSSTTFGLTGCGPTSLAMVYQGLTGKTDKTPHDMAVLAEENGYMSEYEGTDSSFLVDYAVTLGLNSWDIYPAAENIVAELSEGHAIIANLGPGYFTTHGHFFVLAGLTSDGKVIVNDPYSVVRSSQTWDPEFIANESIGMYAYSA